MTLAPGFFAPVMSRGSGGCQFRIARWVSVVSIALSLATTCMAQQFGANPITPLTASANTGFGLQLTFTANYPSGAATLPELDVAVNNTVGGTNGCYFVFFQYPSTTGVPTLYLFDDNVVNWYPVRLGTSDTAQNSHCWIGGQYSSSYYDSGAGALSLTVDLAFQGNWAGALLDYYEQAVDDNTSSSSGWWDMFATYGAWFLVSGNSKGPPSLGTVTSNGSGAPGSNQAMQFTAIDPSGWQAVSEIDVMMSANPSQNSGCYWSFFPYSNTVYLYDDNGDSWYGVQLGSTDSSPASWNSSCSISGQSSSLCGAQ